jgi:glycosyltransferase involved in cell wall biosynthesis
MHVPFDQRTGTATQPVDGTVVALPIADMSTHPVGAGRILLIVPEPFYAHRGSPMNVLQVCRVLTAVGYRVDLATYPLGTDVDLPGLRVHRALRVPGIRSVPIGFSLRKLLLDALLCLTVARLTLSRTYDLVHAVEESVFLALPLTWFGVPVVYDMDSLLSDQLRYSGVIRRRLPLRLARWCERVALARVEAAITVCSSLSEAAREMSPDLRVFQVEDTPLEESYRPPRQETVDRLLDELELTDRRRIVYTGNLEAYQGIDLLLAAAALLKVDEPRATIVLVGGDGARLDDLRRRVQEAGLEDTVLAVGHRPPEEMPEWMALADVLVSPRTDGENTPLKIYTYMNSGRPIVATDLITHTQVLDSSCAVLCSPAPRELARGLARALRDPEVAQLAQVARERADACYSPRAFEQKLLDAYAQVLAPPAS